MGHFPIFLDLAGRRCVVVGGGEGALGRVERLARAGAAVAVVAPRPSRPLLAAIRRGAAVHVAAAFTPAHLKGAALVLVADESLAVSEAVSRAAQSCGIPVNVMDEPRLCSFILPAILERAPVTVAIATGGTAPMLARQVRRWLDERLPQRLGALARLAARFRPLVRRRLADPTRRRRFWERVFEGEVAALTLAGDDAAAGAALLAALGESAAPGVAGPKEAA
jgi:uroporphyrin-III C-methyltransferase/precorrin-2 dehydrogenase/sirohydrochlorin ferrochelatase